MQLVKLHTALTAYYVCRKREITMNTYTKEQFEAMSVEQLQAISNAKDKRKQIEYEEMQYSRDYARLERRRLRKQYKIDKPLTHNMFINKMSNHEFQF